MSVKLTNLTGSGNLVRNSIADYSYSEEVTPLEPSSSAGGISQITITGVAGEDTPLAINNLMELQDSNYGSVQFSVKNVSVSGESAALTGDTVMSRLNVNRTAEPHGGGGSSLLTAIEYYCSMVGIFPSIDEDFANELDAIDVNFLGWEGNVWDHLKKLCSGVSASATDNVGIEMYIDGNDLVFRKAKTIPANFKKISSEAFTVDSFDAAKEIAVYKYATEYAVNRVVRQQERQADGIFKVNENVSITDSMQVEAGQTLTKRFLVNASLSEIKQPDCVSQIFPLPYSGSTGQYVIVGSDELPVSPAQWISQGGNLTVSLTENPYEIEITVIAPPSVTMPTAADPAEVTPAPYKIGVESSGEAEYPALYIVGTGVFFEKSLRIFKTGTSDTITSQTSAVTVDNIFINTDADLSSRGVAAAQAACGPSISLSQSVSDSVSFGLTPGSIITAKNNKFRVSSAAYNPVGVGITASPCATLGDFNAVWTGKGFDDFDDIMVAKGIKFNEFTIIPLIGA
jgi:hypothetical protein